MPQPTVLISGAGIAGPALAFWLSKNGYRVTIVELADGIRPGGQTVDLRGAGGDVVERMGLLPEMQARSLDQRGVAWIKSDGSRRAEMPVTAFNGNGLVSKLEILRAATWSMCCIRQPKTRRSTNSTSALRISIKTRTRSMQP
jgi:2-polyprenyl-6-methoxyphenol hydroxylase-like FAD-dependent oxidoreductase